ncbi:hypothetical protein SDC9_199787 [bioreactor metagenome]|uniref:Uncharacterized protein n=1 Tax=bioreactor metagenome TaxID=1076179 RepID=A0A645IY43_9ZZZZ
MWQKVVRKGVAETDDDQDTGLHRQDESFSQRINGAAHDGSGKDGKKGDRNTENREYRRVKFVYLNQHPGREG